MVLPVGGDKGLVSVLDEFEFDQQHIRVSQLKQSKSDYGPLRWE